MIKQTFFTFLSLFTLTNCNEKVDSYTETDPIQKTKLTGLIEKGPFINGSNVLIYELDNNFSQTGKSFNATTNDEGFFEMTNSMEFASSYVKLVVDGFYFNEITGKLSSTKITLESLANIKDKNSINANLISHLEYKRVLYLIDHENMSFENAKEQAVKELLACFLISDLELSPETVSITDNNTQADILIAISSILLRAVESKNQMDAEFTRLINNFRDDLEMDGQIDEYLKTIIKDASYMLNYNSVKENIENRYKDLGKNISVGTFQYFIDGDGDGTLSEENYEVDAYETVTPENLFGTEDEVKMFTNHTLLSMCNTTLQVYLFDAMFTQCSSHDNAVMLNLTEIYNRQLNPSIPLIQDLYAGYYRVIRNINTLIQDIDKKEELLKYKYAGMVYRAYCYLNMIELWGDVPLIVKTLSIDEINTIIRTPKSDILSFIINDLKEAELHLPEEGNYIICSKYLASALLANAYMQKNDYENVLIKTTTIIQSYKYNLCSNHSEIFKPANKETLFSFLANEDNTSFNLIRKGSEMPMIRYPEILLMSAEANLFQGNISKAVEPLNQLRERNEKTALNINTTPLSVQEAIIEEWKTDMVNEGVYLFALKRFGVAETTLQIPSYMTLLPLPARELLLDRNIQQNPGY